MTWLTRFRANGFGQIGLLIQYDIIWPMNEFGYIKKTTSRVPRT